MLVTQFVEKYNINQLSKYLLEHALSLGSQKQDNMTVLIINL